ncbi:hypothetical protein KC717_02440 [Candidatus Dojkabacteria bacterium]|uniref:Uncharacterized protein n=1 Tax=Candidatus Dojkabacteria bacterium TaxID=2099670 RepID=A0A955RKI4_9BACT|nr:hypothetical protein [Candidatus Dojkabacteria bacterium]
MNWKRIETIVKNQHIIWFISLLVIAGIFFSWVASYGGVTNAIHLEEYDNLYLSLLPDRTGMIPIKIDMLDVYSPSKFTFSQVDFETQQEEVFHTIQLDNEYKSNEPYLGWIDTHLVLIGALSDYGMCTPLRSESALIYNTITKSLQNITCVTRTQDEDELFDKHFIELFIAYYDNPEKFKVFPLEYSTAYSDGGYVLQDMELGTIYLLSRYTQQIEEDEQYFFRDIRRDLSPFVNNPRINNQGGIISLEGQQIYSPNADYYFVQKDVDYLNCGTIEGCQVKRYIDLYYADGRKIRTIFVGKIDSSQQKSNLGYIGYTDFWTNDNELIIPQEVNDSHTVLRIVVP